MDYLETLEALKQEVEDTPQEVIRTELSQELEPEVKKLYDQNFEELLYGDDICGLVGINYYDLSAENINRISYVALLAARRGFCFEKTVEPATTFSLIRALFS